MITNSDAPTGRVPAAWASGAAGRAATESASDGAPSATFRALAWSQDDSTDDDPLPYTGDDYTVPQDDSGPTVQIHDDVTEPAAKPRLRSPLLFGIAAAVAAVAVGGLALTLTNTFDTPRTNTVQITQPAQSRPVPQTDAVNRTASPAPFVAPPARTAPPPAAPAPRPVASTPPPAASAPPPVPAAPPVSAVPEAPAVVTTPEVAEPAPAPPPVVKPPIVTDVFPQQPVIPFPDNPIIAPAPVDAAPPEAPGWVHPKPIPFPDNPVIAPPPPFANTPNIPGINYGQLPITVTP